MTDINLKIKKEELREKLGIKDGKDGLPGKDGEKGDPGDIKDLSPQEIRNSLELLNEEERLDAKAIKNIPKPKSYDAEIKTLQNRTQLLNQIATTRTPDLTQYLKKTNNLDDLADVPTARGNLGVAIIGTGTITGGDITDDGDLTITVSAGTGLIRATDDDLSETIPVTWSAESGTNVDLVAGLNYVYIEYNGGTPQAVATTSERTDHDTNILLGTVHSDGTLHITKNTKIDLPNYVSHTIRRLSNLEPFSRQSGGVISETGTRNIAVTAGTWWEGINQFTTAAIDTSVAGSFIYYYQDGAGGFTEVASQTQINNTQYDDGSGTLAKLTSNRYGVHWVYIEQDGDLSVVYGRGDYVIGEAQDAQPPANLPATFGGNHGRLIGKIIIREGTAVFTSTESAFDVVFTPALVTDHGDLAGLTDDDHPQYPLVDQAILWALAY